MSVFFSFLFTGLTSYKDFFDTQGGPGIIKKKMPDIFNILVKREKKLKSTCNTCIFNSLTFTNGGKFV